MGARSSWLLISEAKQLDWLSAVNKGSRWVVLIIGCKDILSVDKERFSDVSWWVVSDGLWNCLEVDNFDVSNLEPLFSIDLFIDSEIDVDVVDSEYSTGSRVMLDWAWMSSASEGIVISWLRLIWFETAFSSFRFDINLSSEISPDFDNSTLTASEKLSWSVTVLWPRKFLEPDIDFRWSGSGGVEKLRITGSALWLNNERLSRSETA